jgi:hypothetical protein
MRRRLSFAVAALAVAAVPFAGAAAVHGCSDEQPFESVCLWVADPDNCYRKFRIDSEAAGNDCKPVGDPTPAVSGGDNGTPNGSFLSRTMLDVCFINGGGQVVFDPPLDLTKFPPSLLENPITYKMTFKNGDGTECGGATYSSPHGFSFTINPPADAGSADGGGLLLDAGSTDGGPGTAYGSYTQVIQPGRDAFDVTCPTGETHHLDLFEVEGATVTDDGGLNGVCPVVQKLVPHAEFTVNPGGIDVAGAVSFTIYWPPIGAGVTYPALDAGIQSLSGSSPPIQPVAVTYFNCSIGAAPQTCVDGVKDGTETDIDCGGKESSPGCPARCGDGQGCSTDCDCDSSLVCTVKSGVKVCGSYGTGGAPSAPPARDCSSYVSCQDQVRDGDETDKDCGGTQCAQRCSNGQSCLVDSDCLSNYCANKICATANCTNMMQDPGEVGVDCGGPCPACPNGTPCTQNSDCATGNCVNNKCADANCTDNTQNGSETDVDCGGPACPPCANLKKCVSNSDCQNLGCVNGVCLFPSCSDGVQDGDETDKDCGGSKCDPCADGAGCANDTDCTSTLCGFTSPTVKKCFPTSCLSDAGVQAVCGGGTCPLCPDGSLCTKNSDCLNNGCVNGVCNTPTCTDVTQDGTETDVDCGGPACPGCGPGEKCLVDTDCKSFVAGDGGTGMVCINKVCQQ